MTNQEKNNIASANSAVKQAETDIAIAKEKVTESSKKIETAKEEAKKMLVFYQIMNSGDNYLGYINESDSVTDMFLRTEAVSQIVKFNQDKINELEDLITTNENLQVELTKKEAQLEQDIIRYENSLENLNSDLDSLLEVSLDISDQIKAQQKLIDYYEDIGCKDDQLLSKCVADVANNAGWLKPTQKGYISSGFGYRTYTLNGKKKTDFHNGNDIAGNPGGTPVYAAAAGTVAATISKAKCGGNQVFIHVRVKGVAYTLGYAHLKDIKVKVGDAVTNQTIIGTVGGGGNTLKKNGGWDTCSTGYHLHFVVAKGFYLGGGSEGYSSYSKYTANAFQPPMLPAYGKWFYSR